MSNETGEVRAFSEIVQELRGGALLEDLTLELNALVTAVRETKRKGSLTLKIHVAPIKDGDADRVTVVDDLAVKLPRPPHLAEVAGREARRIEKLAARNLVAEDRVDRATTDARAREAACQAARAALEVARARIDAARAALALTYLKAPFEGVVAEVNAELGEYVTPSPPGIATLPAVDLIDDQCLYVARTDRQHHAPTRPQLLDQCQGNALGRRRHDDAVERGVLGQTDSAIRMFGDHVANPQAAEPLACLFEQYLYAFGRVDTSHQGCEYRGLIAGARPDLQYVLQRTTLDQDLGHARHDVRLRDRLTLADR